MSDELPTLPADQFVPGTEGLFEIPAEVYHDQSKAPGISRSILVEFMQLSPAHAASILNGKHKKVITKPMTSGSLVDMALLEPHKFIEGVSHWVVPAGMDLTTKSGIAWKKDHPGIKEPGGLPYIKAVSDAANEASAEDMDNIIDSLMAHSKVRHIVEQARKQESAFCYDPVTGLLRKVRPDARLFDGNARLVLADLKVTFRGGVTEHAWQQQCSRKGYHYQNAYYSRTYKDLVGEMPMFVFIAVERKPPYACRMFQVDPEGIEHAEKRCRAALDYFRRCQDTGVWPSFNEEIKVIKLARWELMSPDPESDL